MLTRSSRRSWTASALAALALLAIAASSASAFPISGSRATSGTSGNNGQIVWNPAAGNWSGGNFSIAWNVALGGTNGGYQEFNYTYTINTPSGGDAKLSHAIIELSTGVTSTDVYNIKYTGQTVDGIATWPNNPGNVGIPSALFGLKVTRGNVDAASTVLTFTSIRAPRWGDFYAKDGGGTGDNAVYAYNVKFGTEAADPYDYTDATHQGWILTPDSVVVAVPEPTTVAIAGLGALGFLGYGFRRRVRRA